MTDTAKPKSAKPPPVWWRNRQDWHRDSELESASAEYREKIMSDEDAMLRSDCGSEEFVEYCDIRRSAPPVAQQCQRCRAAKAKQRKEQAK